MDRPNSGTIGECVIVAIPSDDDPVWKVSSEKTPHMTLLYLGPQVFGPTMMEIAQFVQHAAEMTLREFTMAVNRRGILGEAEADVLFFEHSFANELKEFRSFLLKNETIAKTYLSAEQYPKWIPHLTLGYPDSPAKPDNRENPSFRWVDFDRIAVWFGDYEGPEFRLKNRFDEAEVSMSDIRHYGIKGMKWGVRRTDAQLARARSQMNFDPDSGDTKSIKKIKKKVQKNQGRIDSLSNKELQEFVSRMNLEQQYSRLTQQPTTIDKIEKGQRNARAILGVARTAQDVYSLANGPLGKAIRKAIINA